MKLLLASIPPSEKIREEQAKKEKRLNRKFRKMVGGMQGVLWIMTPIWYLLSSFVTDMWHLTWLVFPLIGAVKGLINAIMDLKEAADYEN